ncbi:hypothetical protein EV401DRAFT_1590209 [Pisolithus croceorrhizus]|nr:hypothetical protein EV401DRAFT_1590209 [Pisolithus croceorrhizus]
MGRTSTTCRMSTTSFLGFLCPVRVSVRSLVVNVGKVSSATCLQPWARASHAQPQSQRHRLGCPQVCFGYQLYSSCFIAWLPQQLANSLVSESNRSASPVYHCVSLCPQLVSGSPCRDLCSFVVSLGCPTLTTTYKLCWMCRSSFRPDQEPHQAFVRNGA